MAPRKKNITKGRDGRLLTIFDGTGSMHTGNVTKKKTHHAPVSDAITKKIQLLWMLSNFLTSVIQPVVSVQWANQHAV